MGWIFRELDIMALFYEGLPFWVRILVFFVAGSAAWLIARKKPDLITGITSWLGQIAKRPVSCIALILLTTLAVNFVCSIVRYPHPMCHDEFSYLLGADTYASGRATNPTHPHWRHFETFHVISQPSYMSKYPPANALLLAIGQSVTGHPIVGSWFAMALALIGLHWMLCGWMSRKWALIGTLLLALNVPMIMAWGQSYWGGGIQMLGGALLFGALRRIVDKSKRSRPIWVYSLVLGIGASILALSRPFEGLLVCLVAGVVLFIWLIRLNELSFGRKLTQTFIPAGIIGLFAFAIILLNNMAVTGEWTKMPYSVHSTQYESTNMFIWGSLPKLPEYNLPRMEKFYTDWVRERQLDARSLHGYTQLISGKLMLLWRFFPFIGGICLLPILYLVRNNAWLKFAVIVTAGLILVEFQMVHSRTYPHYIAPIACLFYFALFQGLRTWDVLGRKNKDQSLVLPTVVGYSLLSLIAYCVIIGTSESPSRHAALESKLEQLPGNHLVFVRYPEDHNLHMEMTYNKADIDHSKIVWANELSNRDNRELVDHFQDRQVWIWDLGNRTFDKYQLDAPSQLAGGHSK